MGEFRDRAASSGWAVDIDKSSVAVAAIDTENRIIERVIFGGLVMVTLAIAAYIRWEVLGVRSDRTTRRSVERARRIQLGSAVS